MKTNLLFCPIVGKVITNFLVDGGGYEGVLKEGIVLRDQ
jgi:hypothetical protein